MEPRGLSAVSMLEQLPLDIMTKALDFVQLPDCLRVATGSKVLNRLIMKECTALWETIDFSGFSKQRRDGLRDEMLSGLLTRVRRKDRDKEFDSKRL